MAKASKKLLIAVNYFYPYVSGVSEYARYVAKCLSDEFNVTVLTGLHDRELETVEQVDGYRVVRARTLFFLDKGYVSAEFFTLFRKLAKEADVVNIHFPMLESGLLSMMTRKPILLTYQCDMALVGSLVSRLAVGAVRQSGKLALKRARRVAVLSLDYASHSEFLAPHKSKCVEISPPNRFETVRQDLSFLPASRKEGSKIIGFVGRFVKEKGIDVLLRCAQDFSGEKVVFWLAGDFKNVAGGSVIDEIKSNIQELGDQVVLLGNLSDQELVAFYSTIDILALPSVNRFEAFGMVQLEAMSYGAIPVTSDLPGVREVIKRTGIGRLVEPGSAESLCSGLRAALEDREKYDREQIKCKVKNCFDNSNFYRSYRDIVNTLSDSEPHV